MHGLITTNFGNLIVNP